MNGNVNKLFLWLISLRDSLSNFENIIEITVFQEMDLKLWEFRGADLGYAKLKIMVACNI